jgi:hypothetical protein
MTYTNEGRSSVCPVLPIGADAGHGGRARPGYCKRGYRPSLKAGTADLRKRGNSTWRRRAPQGFRPKGRDMAAAPESGSRPTSSPALVLVVVPVSVTHSRSMTSRPLRASGATGPALGVPKARPC